jgi:hypothetical protein
MPKKPKAGEGSRARILAFLLANVGRVIEGREIYEASGGASEWARRVRELRDEKGYKVRTHKDSDDLKPGQYVLESPHPDARYIFGSRAISKETRAFVLERNGYTCQMCGLGASDPNPLRPGRKIQLVMGHIIDKSKGGEDTPNNLRAICSNCNEGLQAISPPKPRRIELMKQLRRATIDDQLHALDWLLAKFGKRRSEE